MSCDHDQVSEWPALDAVHAKVMQQGNDVPTLLFYDGAGTLFLVDEERDGIGDMDDRQLSLLWILADRAKRRVEEEQGKRP